MVQLCCYKNEWSVLWSFDKYEAAYAALIDTIVQSNEIMFVAGKASNGLNDDFEIIKLQKPFKSNAVYSFAISKVNYD